MLVLHPTSCMRYQATHLPKWQRGLHCRATQSQGEARAVQISRNHSGQASHLRPWQYAAHLPQHGSTASGLLAGNSGKQAGPNISKLAPHLQQEWDHAANAHLGRVVITPHSHSKVWWRSGMCKTGQPHRWQATVSNRSNGRSCPYNTGKAVCPCNDLAHNYPEVAAEWDWEANVERTPETVSASSNIKAAWRCGLCGHRWSATVSLRTKGTGCPQCAREARRIQTRQPSISIGAPHLLAEWDREANKKCGWQPDQITLGSGKKVHWVVHDECKLGLVHRWQASPNDRITLSSGSPFPSGKAVCACNSLAVQCPEAADLWDSQNNGDLTPGGVAVQSVKVVAWKGPDGSQWQQKVREVVMIVRRHQAKANK